MRYRLLIFVIVLMLILQGCAKSQGKMPESLTDGFEANISVNYQDNNYEAKITRTAPGQCKIEMTKPLLLKSMTFEWTGTEIIMSYLGLKQSISPQSLPNAAFGDAIVKVLDALTAVNGLDIKKDGDSLLISGSIDSGPFQLSVNNETGEIATLALPSIKLSVTFKDFKKI